MVHMASDLYIYCPKCGSTLDLSGVEPVCSECKFIFYQNSKPCVGIIPIKDGRALLCKRGAEPYIHEYDIIGGFLGNGEHPLTGLVREVKEELDLDLDTNIKVVDLLGFYINNYGSELIKTLDIFYIGEIVSGTPKFQDDIEGLEWHPIANLPKSPLLSVSKALIDLPNWYSKHQDLLK